MPDFLECSVWCEGVTRLVGQSGAVHVAARVSAPGVTRVTCHAPVSAPHVQVDIVTGGRKLQKYL